MGGFIYSESSGLNNAVIGKKLAPVRAIISECVEAFQNASLIDKIFFMDKSKSWASNYTSETSLGGFQDVGEGGAFPQDSFQEGFDKTVQFRVWKDQFTVTKEMLDDANVGKIKSKSNMFAQAYGRGREGYAAALLAGGVGKTVKYKDKVYDTTSADGVPLFSAAHPSKTKGTKYTQSNLFKGVFSQTVMDQMQEKMQDFTDDDGNILSVMPDTIIIPNNAKLKRAVFAAVGSELDPDTNNNAMNFQLGLWNVLIWPYLPKQLAEGDYFMMADSDFLQTYMCLPFVDRVPLQVDSHIDNNTWNTVFQGYARYGAGFNNWRGIAICGTGLSDGTALA